jgi:tRNA 2-thiouridine synthesizing protein A
MRTFKAVKVGTNHFEVDLRGWVCPFPKYAVAGRLDLLVDCPSAPEDVPKVARELGCVGTEVEVLAPGEWRVAIRT